MTVPLHLYPDVLITCLHPERNAKPPAEAQNEWIITVSAIFKRCGIETKLILSSGKGEQPHARTLNALQEALRKALQWQLAFTSVEIPSLAAIARQEHVSQRRIAHLLHLAYLAPDIMESILTGDVPLTFTLSSLKYGIPLNWQEQRKVLGFCAT